MKKTEFGPLYAKTSNGKTEMWKCIVIEDNKGLVTLNVIHGYIDGKQSTDTRDVESKNIGKLNETSRWEQGISEAQSKEKKKRDKGYLDTIDEVATTEIFLPMLAQKYKERKKYVKWPAYAQPKLNGVRCTCKKEGKEITYTSRTGKSFKYLSHLTPGTKEAVKSLTVLDGEIFNRELSLQEIASANNKMGEETETLEYWIYDIVDTKLTFEERNIKIQKFFDENSNGNNELGFRKFYNLVEVPTYEIKDESELISIHKMFTETWNFEGAIIRNKEGLYKLKHRSNDLLKYKTFLDDEFEIIGGKQASGSDIGTVVFQCKTKEGNEFEVRPKGSRKLRREWFKNLDSLIGRMLTVRYQSLSDSGTPTIVTGLAIRDYE